MNQDTTVKIPALSSLTEVEHYQRLYLEAGNNMLTNFSKETAKAYGEAQCKLQEVEDLYRQGYQLLLQKSQEKQTL